MRDIRRVLRRPPPIPHVPWPQLPLAARLLVLIMAAVAALAVLASLVAVLLSPLPWVTFLLFLGISAVTAASRTPVSPREEQGPDISLEEAWHLAAAFLLTPAQAIVLAAVSKAPAQLWLRPGWYKIVFNTANRALAVGAASLAFRLIAGPEATALPWVLGAATGGLLHFILNQGLVHLAMALASGRSPLSLWRAYSQPLWTHQVATISIAGLIALAWQQQPLVVVFVALPLAAIAVAVRQAAQLGEWKRTTLLPSVPAVERARVAENPLQLLALDQGRILYRGEPLLSDRLRSASAGELLFFLAEHPGGVSMDGLCDGLGPEEKPHRMRSQIHSSTYRLRRAMSQEVVVFGEGLYRINPVGWWYDVANFRASLERAASADPRRKAELLSAAVGLYRSDYLPSVYSDWTQAVRMELLDQYLEAVADLAALWVTLGEPDRAEALALSGLEKDPHLERLYRSLIQAALAQGDQGAALRWYERCRQALRELGVEPSPATSALLR